MINRYKPTIEDKRRLPGKSNVEALLYSIDARSTKPATLILVGRASHEIGDIKFHNKMRELLGEQEKISSISQKALLTDDSDIYYTEDADEAVGIASKGSFVAELCDCYLHPLGEQTLCLVKGWESRLQNVPELSAGPMEKITYKRLDPLDFIICKAAAGRPKDEKFLSAFIQTSEIKQESIEEKLNALRANPKEMLGTHEQSLATICNLLQKIQNMPKDEPEIEL